MPAINGDWLEALKGEFRKEYYKKLFETVNAEYRTRQIFPPADDVFNAFHLTPLKDVKVVIFGQDPYHGPGQAHGLCFSVNDGIPFPPSLRNIFKEINNDLGTQIPDSGNLTRWAVQGVLLLNATLTVREHCAGSHQRQGWETFTDAVIKTISDNCENVVFILWGSYAQSKSALIDASRHLVLKSVHPSPLSAHAGFFGNHHFSRANDYLQTHGKLPISW